MPAQVNKPVASSFSAKQDLVDVLLRKNLISKQQFDDLKMESVNTGRGTEVLIEEKKLVVGEQLTQAKAEYYNVPFIVLKNVGVEPEAMNRVPENVARRYNIFPFAIDRVNKQLKVAMVNPVDLTAIEFVEQKSGMRVAPFMATKEDVDAAIEDRYSKSLSSEVVAALKETGEVKVGALSESSQIGKVIREAPIAKIVSTILEFAMKARASDIHIEPLEQKTRVRYRIDGLLQEKLVLPQKVHDAVISRIKILSGMKIDEKRVPQDGRFNFRSTDQSVDLRVSSLPSTHGEKIVMRLSVPTSSKPSEILSAKTLKNMDQL